MASHANLALGDTVVTLELHIGSAAFWSAARRDIAAARHRVLIQAMTFEGDAAGQSVAEAIANSTAADVRVLVDDYSRHVINDTFVAFSRSTAIKEEAAETQAMFERLARGPAKLRMTNPVGRKPLLYPMRNHKKLLVMDDVAWLGGINFSDHNFAWHDMMVRIADREVAEWLAGRFACDWEGTPGTATATVSGIELFDLDGADNARALAPVLALFAGARRSIEVVSAYPTFPFVDAMATAARRGAQVTIYTPRPNNKPIVRDYLLGVAARAGISLRLLPEMSHVKATLVDGEALVIGSSNFDFLSHRVNAEYLAIVRDPALIAAFEARLLAPARAAASAPAPTDHSRARSLRAHLSMRIVDRLVARLPHGPRIAEWNP